MTPIQFNNLKYGKAITIIVSGQQAGRTEPHDCITCAIKAHAKNVPENCKQCPRYKGK